MMNDEENVSPQVLMWKDKYDRLARDYISVLNINKELEDRLLTVVDKIERDKSLLSDEIDHLADKLACSTNTIDRIKNECARYKSDCMVAVHLLRCQPSFYTTQHMDSIPPQIRQTFMPDSAQYNGSIPGMEVPERRTKFSAAAVTFPPTAVFLQTAEDRAETSSKDEQNAASDGVRDVFVSKILAAPEYQTEKLTQCAKCGHTALRLDQAVQTDSHCLPNSHSAPHLAPLQYADWRTERDNQRSHGPGELLINLSNDPGSPCGSPPLDDSSAASSLSTRGGPSSPMDLRFPLNPGVHQVGVCQQLKQQHHSEPVDLPPLQVLRQCH